MIKLANYNLEKCYIGSISASQETDTYLLDRGLNPIHYSKGFLTLVNEDKAFAVPEETTDFFEGLHNLDVLEIYENGTLRLQCSEFANDNTLFITSKCNSNCVMCPSGDYSRREGTIPEQDEIMDLIRHYPYNTKHITITGGEPFLFRDAMFQALSYLKENLDETEFLVLTNGRIFCLDNYVEQLNQSIPRYTTLAIPLHGSTAEKHDRITRSDGSFTQTISGISKLLAAHIPVELRIVVSGLNSDDLTSIAQLIITQIPSVYSIHFIGLEMLGNAAINNKEVWIPYRKAFKAAKEAVDLLINAGINVAFYNFPLCSVESAYWPICKKSISEYKRNFPEPCQKCKYKLICGGVFTGSLRYSINDLHPFEEET